VEYGEHFRLGVRLFNERSYWHAHEAWEDAWKVEADERTRLFYKGIIQTAAALVHWQRGNGRGLTLNWRKARRKLVTLPSPFHGFDLGALIAAMDRFEAAGGAGLEPPMLVILP
jgi:uncharacterized protein